MRTDKGVTLIELMVVVAIVAILASIAYPSYQQYVLRSNRTEGRAALMQAAQGLEKCFTQFGTYTPTAPNVCPTIGTYNTEHGLYTINASQPNVQAATFTITATPLGAQLNDTTCATLSLDNTNRKDATPTANALTCWK